MPIFWRELTPDSYVRYDSDRDECHIVPADEAPPLVPHDVRPLPGATDGAGEQVRLYLALGSMIDTQLSRRTWPVGAGPLLLRLASSLRDDAALARLEQAFAAVQDGIAPSRGPRPYLEREAAGPPVATAGLPVLKAAGAGQPLTREQLVEFARDLPAVPRRLLRVARVWVMLHVEASRTEGQRDEFPAHDLARLLMRLVATAGGPL